MLIIVVVSVKSMVQCGGRIWTRSRWYTCSRLTRRSDCVVTLTANHDPASDGTKTAKTYRPDRSARYRVVSVKTH